MRGQGHQAFVGKLTRFAAEAGPGRPEGRLTAIAQRAAAPLRVVVRGRRGVGRATVERALKDATIVDARPEVVVYAIAEVVKPEDSRAVHALVAARCPVLVVLNKADVAGFAGDGPMAVARARGRHFSDLLGVPVQPMSGLLAVAARGGVLDEAWWSSVGARPVDTLGPFGAAVADAALRRGYAAPQVRALLRRVSGVDAVLDQLAVVGAEVRYRRVLDAVTELEALAVSDGEIAGFLARDDTVIARMAAAADVAECAGLQVAPCHDAAAYLSRAVRWQRYSRAQASNVHRACGADIVRGSLRLWAKVGGAV